MESFVKIKESYYDIHNINQDSIHERWHIDLYSLKGYGVALQH